MVRGERNSCQHVDWGFPVNLGHPLAYGLQIWWLAVPLGRTGYGSKAYWRDLMGRYNGTMVNMGQSSWKGQIGPTWGSLEFDGSDDTCRNDSWPGLGAPCSWACTVRTTTSQTDNYIWGQVIKAANTNYCYLAQNAGNAARFVANNAGVAFQSVVGSTALNSGAPFRVCGTMSSAGVMKLYVNGKSEGTPATWGTPTGSFTRVNVGILDRLSAAAVWAGRVDSCMAWNRELSAGQAALDFREWQASYPYLLNRPGSRRGSAQTASTLYSWWAWQQFGQVA